MAAGVCCGPARMTIRLLNSVPQKTNLQATSEPQRLKTPSSSAFFLARLEVVPFPSAGLLKRRASPTLCLRCVVPPRRCAHLPIHLPWRHSTTCFTTPCCLLRRARTGGFLQARINCSPRSSPVRRKRPAITGSFRREASNSAAGPRDGQARGVELYADRALGLVECDPADAVNFAHAVERPYGGLRGRGVVPVRYF